MITKPLTLEISESLYQQLEQLAFLTEESIEDIAISMIAKNILCSTQQAKDLKEKIDNLLP